MMPRRIRLKVAIVEAGYSQRHLARLLGITEVRLSDIVTGTATPRQNEAAELSELPRTFASAGLMAPAVGCGNSKAFDVSCTGCPI
jgi:transcriptional regulator with XRE-family HTH domain